MSCHRFFLATRPSRFTRATDSTDSSSLGQSNRTIFWFKDRRTRSFLPLHTSLFAGPTRALSKMRGLMPCNLRRIFVAFNKTGSTTQPSARICSTVTVSGFQPSGILVLNPCPIKILHTTPRNYSQLTLELMTILPQTVFSCRRRVEEIKLKSSTRI